MNLLDQFEESPDFTWLDLISDSDSPVSLDDINPVPLTDSSSVNKIEPHVPPRSVPLPKCETVHVSPHSANTYHIRLPISSSSEPKTSSLPYKCNPFVENSDESSDEYMSEDEQRKFAKPLKSGVKCTAFLNNEDLNSGRPVSFGLEKEVNNRYYLPMSTMIIYLKS